jgi:bifunctional non-homologous end joining protein LigD
MRRYGLKTKKKVTGRGSGAAVREAAARGKVKSTSPIVSRTPAFELPRNENEVVIRAGKERIRLTNLQKVFWPESGLTKRDLLQYYLDVSPWLLPHIQDRAMVMKRYPNGIAGEFFFMKRAPEPRPSTIPICSIEHGSGNVIGFPVIEDVTSLLWVVNLGCIDLNPWYARCDDVHRPDYLLFDLDPTEAADFEKVLETALVVRDALLSLKIKSYAKTTGSRGIHVYVPIERGPVQKEVWNFAKVFSQELAARNSKLITAEYRVAKRPAGHVLVDYNQNAWNRTLASVYSVRPKPGAPVSTPVTWEEVERGMKIEDFTMLNVPERVAKIGDLWRPLLAKRGRVDLQRVL